jgi:membrane protein implicated in regulation of membrane protease activity
MSTNLWWIWMILAALFFIGEIFTAAFFILWFGVGAVAAGVLALIGAGLGWQFAVFIVVSFVLVVASRRSFITR